MSSVLDTEPCLAKSFSEARLFSKNTGFRNSVLFGITVLFPKTRVFKSPSFQKYVLFKNTYFQKYVLSKTRIFKNSVLFKNTYFQKYVLSKIRTFQKFRAFQEHVLSKIPIFSMVFGVIKEAQPFYFFHQKNHGYKHI